MRFRLRKTLRFGPFKVHFNERGYSGWGVKVGPWSWSASTGKHTVDTPGPGYVQTRGRARRSPGRRR